jgi:hypothetical protein
MKKLLKITALLFTLMLIVTSCGRSPVDDAKTVAKVLDVNKNDVYKAEEMKDFSKSEGKSESKSDAERFCEISKKMMAIESRKTTSRDIENLDKWDIEVANFEKKYKNNKEFIKRYKACMKEK